MGREWASVRDARRRRDVGTPRARTAGDRRTGRVRLPGADGVRVNALDADGGVGIGTSGRGLYYCSPHAGAHSERLRRRGLHLRRAGPRRRPPHQAGAHAGRRRGYPWRRGGQTGWLSARIQRLIADGKLPRSPAARALPGAGRGRETLDLLALGLNNDEIADRLFVSASTTKKHVVSIYDKLDVRTRAQAVAWAWKNGVAQSAEPDA